MANNKYYGNLLTTAEAAKYLGVSYNTILNYVRKGLISAIDLSHGTRAVYGFHEPTLIDFDSRRNKIKKVSKKPKTQKAPKTKVQLQQDLDYVREMAILKAKVKMLSEQLLDISVKLDELSK